jgi:hypothetical protein
VLIDAHGSCKAEDWARYPAEPPKQKNPTNVTIHMGASEFMSAIDGLSRDDLNFIQSRYQSYDTSMGDPWRNDFSDDSQSDDDHRREWMINDIMDHLPQLSYNDVENLLDRYS